MSKTLIFTAFLGLITGWACTSKETKPSNKSAQKVQETPQERVRPASLEGTSAAYFTYANNLPIPDTLLSVQTDAAGMSQVHESYKTKDGMMGMREQKEIIVQPGEEIAFKQGGLHVMLMNVAQDLVVGDSVTVILEFSGAGKVSKKLPVLQ